MDKLYTCFKCKGSVIKRNGTEFCSDCGEIFHEDGKENPIVLDAQFEEETQEEPSTEIMSEDEKVLQDMYDIVNEGAEEREKTRKQLKGFEQVEYDIENAGKVIWDLLSKDY